MIQHALPRPDAMYDAIVRRDASFDGIFFTAVRTTGIFCRPGCPARTPSRRNVEFFGSAKEALFNGYRACKRCHPLEVDGAGTPEWLRPLLDEIDAEEGRRWRDADLRARGLEPARVRRWFRRQHGMTFHAYLRARRVGRALATLREGESVTHVAYDSGFESLSAFYDAFRRLLDTTPARASDAQPLHFTRIDTPLGAMLAAAREDALCMLEFVDRRMIETQLKRLGRKLGGSPVPAPNAVLEQTQRELDAYFAGTLRDFTVPLAPAGTDFQQRVWKILTTIEYGTTRSYGQQAVLIGQPTATRAVARANGDNPIAIIIPCHRVVGSDGKLTGYGGGLWRKQWLLEHESGGRLL
ncbi:MAG TPA: trifunctional transcriptional activator/DNA repair protein Ada/methylated-DNA--[protein]-cysteine S-methyltransferase [Longimicrobiales bacterium]|nr:trifunctional transcriptional activator/DNA repair protein Ada/methylated-DNA--[protein]-cysteine S-methyltransferase [Longimicrobiales bacterium]